MLKNSEAARRKSARAASLKNALFAAPDFG